MINLCRTSPFGPPAPASRTRRPGSTTSAWACTAGLGARRQHHHIRSLPGQFRRRRHAEPGCRPAGSTRTGSRGPRRRRPARSWAIRSTPAATAAIPKCGSVFKVRPGPFVNTATLAAMAARWTYEPALNGRYGTDGNPGTWPNWYSARMDTAEQAGVPASLRSPGCPPSTRPIPASAAPTRAADPNDPGRPGQRHHARSPLHARIADRLLRGLALPAARSAQSGWHQLVSPIRTRGGRFREAEILPSSMAADTTWNCVLYVDHHDDRDGEDQYLEERA